LRERTLVGITGKTKKWGDLYNKKTVKTKTCGTKKKIHVKRK